jgi:carbamoyltransferase
MKILGISAYYHDSAAVLLDQGNLVAAVQEERFTRLKGDERFPHHAIDYCLRAASIELADVDHVVFYENPLLKFERLLRSYHLTAPRSLVSFLHSMPSWLTRKLWLEKEIQRELGGVESLEFCEHHLAHAASAYFPCPYEEAAVLTVDGVGEWATSTIGCGRGAEVELLQEMRFPNSLGLLYSAFTYFTGFKINSGEYKLMGLAPYGEPRFADTIKRELMDLRPDGSIVLNQHYFNYVEGLVMTSEHFDLLFDGPARVPESKISQREMDLAASIQAVVNESVLAMGQHCHQMTGQKHLVMAGGVALNVVATGLLSREGPYDEIWIQPASGDAGGALGAAYWYWHQVLGEQRQLSQPDGMKGAFLGPDIAPENEDDDAILNRLGAKWEALDEKSLIARLVDALSSGKVVAVARGRMEYGPRALGARSILGDARSQDMQRHMNQKIKFRESFRPFAPMVLAEEASKYFDLTQDSPYMLLAYPVAEEQRHPIEEEIKGFEMLNLKRSTIPAVTHVDFSARIQTIDRERNPFIHSVLSGFFQATECPVVVNTSFNVRGEPIVCTVEDAYRCLMATEIDCLVVGNRFLEREQQEGKPLNEQERAAWLERFELD